MKTHPLSIQTATGFTVSAHPIALMSIVESHLRRPEHNDFAIGILLGGTKTDASLGVVSVENAFAVPFSRNQPNENDDGPDFSLNLEYLKQMLDLHAISGSKVSGWFITGPVDQEAAAINDAMSRFLPGVWPMVVLSVNCQQQQANPDTADDLEITAFVDAPVMEAAATSDTEPRRLGTLFQPIPYEIDGGLDKRDLVAIKTASESGGKSAMPANRDQWQAEVSRLQSMLASVTTYVNSVASGKISGDPRVFHMLSAMLARQELLAKSQQPGDGTDRQRQDVETALAIESLVRTQISVAEKLQLASK